MAESNFDIDAFIRRMERAQETANEENARRYEALLTHIDTLGQQTGAAGTFGQAQQLMEQIGGAARTRIQEQSIKTQAMAEQDLTSRGLGSTTMRTSARRGVASDTQRALAEQAEKEAAQKAGLVERRAGLETQIGGMKAAAIEGRQDVGPDMASLAALMQAAAAGEDSGRRTVTSTAGSIGPGIVTRTQAAQAASAAGGGAGGRGGEGGLSTGRGGAGIPPAKGRVVGPGAGLGYDPYTDSLSGRATGLTGPGQTAYSGGTGLGGGGGGGAGGGLILSPQGPASGVQQGGGYIQDEAGKRTDLSPGGEVTTGTGEESFGPGGAIPEIKGEASYPLSEAKAEGAAGGQQIWKGTAEELKRKQAGPLSWFYNRFVMPGGK